jgi:hypothetical protein
MSRRLLSPRVYSGQAICILRKLAPVKTYIGSDVRTLVRGRICQVLDATVRETRKPVLARPAHLLSDSTCRLID